ncbi:MAG TPA: YdeI/OmpD-associated family protein, partial [Polyangium sp.]|nr:YdeI/OmpD-associated family protein [Polyangium sp.]
PKKTSGIKTDLSRDEGWKSVFDAGFGPVTQVAVDETWSALRFKIESTVERKSGSVVAPGGAKKSPGPPKKIVPPDDLITALEADEAACATWRTLAPSHIKEYVTWIEEAKKPETRARRIQNAITMLAEGVRDRNAKYAGR